MNDRTVIKNIARNLKELRKKRKLTQEELTQEIGEENISLRSYKSYENEDSTRVPLLDKISILADYFNCSLDYLVFNKDSIYSDSFTKKDNLKRLCCLIYSLSLLPFKDTDENSKYCNKYYFLSYDEDVSLLMDKITSLSREKNYLFKYKGINDLEMLKHYYNAIEDIQDLDVDLSPTIDRANQLLLESGIDPDEYYNNCINDIKKCRSINELNKTNN